MIGLLDQRITLESLTRVSDGQGGNSETWAPVATVWARVMPKSGREVVSSDGVAAEGSYTFKIRQRSDISEVTRLTWGGEIYNIRNVLRRGDRVQFLELQAERNVA